MSLSPAPKESVESEYIICLTIDERILHQIATLKADISEKFVS